MTNITTQILRDALEIAQEKEEITQEIAKRNLELAELDQRLLALFNGEAAAKPKSRKPGAKSKAKEISMDYGFGSNVGSESKPQEHQQRKGTQRTQGTQGTLSAKLMPMLQEAGASGVHLRFMANGARTSMGSVQNWVVRNKKILQQVSRGTWALKTS